MNELHLFDVKTCTNCKIEQPIAHFYTRNGKPKEWCKDCEKAYQRVFYHNNPERQRKRAANWREKYADRVAAARKTRRPKTYLYELSKKYGVSKESAELMLMQANGMCVCCGRKFSECVGLGAKNLDHCHCCGKARAFICGRCNSVIGIAQDNPAYLVLCAEYLKGHQCITS